MSWCHGGLEPTVCSTARACLLQNEVLLAVFSLRFGTQASRPLTREEGLRQTARIDGVVHKYAMNRTLFRSEH